MPATVPVGGSLWTQQFSGGQATSVAASPVHPVVYVTGWTPTSQHEPGYPRFPVDDITTVAYSSQTGAQLWESHYQGNGFLGAGHPVVAVSPDGSSVYVADTACLGTPHCARIGSGDVIVAYSAATGADIWSSSGVGTFPSDVAVSADGTVFVTGSAHFDAYVTEAFSPRDGSEEFSQDTGPHGPDRVNDQANGLAVSGSTAFVTGTAGVVAVGGTGSTPPLVWDRTSAASRGLALALSHDSSVLLVAGCKAPLSHPPLPCRAATILTAYFAPTGHRLWSLDDGATQVVASPSGAQVFIDATVSGGHTALSSYDIGNNLRTRLWQARVISGTVMVSPKDPGTVFVVGTSLVAACSAATGARLWEASYSYPGTRAAMTLSEDGSKLIVTGTTPSGGYLTEAFKL